MKNLDFVLLLDCYGGLLTERQRDLLDGYYNEDLSLAELAEPRGISRQAVHDSIRRGERQLLSFEEQMGLAARLKNCRSLFEKIEILTTQLSDSDSEIGSQIADAAKDGKALL
ncbi:MAG: helix-turn-helix domain-containing protein [Oscillospiraceae bacterium]|nr:helix-turn-helix domain-containing protein [Oscillospiraceae bacterium]